MMRLNRIKPLIFGLSSCVYLPFANAAAIQWPISDSGNDHYYDVIVQPGIDWVQAKSAAELRGGYLVTILSQAENDFLFANFVSKPENWVLSGFAPPYEGQAAGPDRRPSRTAIDEPATRLAMAE